MADSPPLAVAVAVATAADASGDGAAPPPDSKRQRRPSVRLGDLGTPVAAASAAAHHKPHTRRPKAWNHAGNRPRLLLPPPLRRDAAKQPSKPRPIHEAEAVDGGGGGLRRARDVKACHSSDGGAGVRRVRSSWTSAKAKDAAADAVVKLRAGEGAGENGYQGLDGGDEELWVEDSQSPSEKRHGVARVRIRVSENQDLGIVADTEEQDVMEEYRKRNDFDGNGWCGGLGEGGVRSWLDRLGLGRYSSVFEVHEVDDEVLPLLTLEDLRDMGIAAVGSRRKLFWAIQKLRKRH